MLGATGGSGISQGSRPGASLRLAICPAGSRRTSAASTGPGSKPVRPDFCFCNCRSKNRVPRSFRYFRPRWLRGCQVELDEGCAEFSSTRIPQDELQYVVLFCHSAVSSAGKTFPEYVMPFSKAVRGSVRLVCRALCGRLGGEADQRFVHVCMSYPKIVFLRSMPFFGGLRARANPHTKARCHRRHHVQLHRCRSGPSVQIQLQYSLPLLPSVIPALQDISTGQTCRASQPPPSPRERASGRW